MAILIFFSHFWRLKNPSKSLDFRISRFWRNQQQKARLGAVCCCDKTAAATVAVVEDSDIIVAKEEGKQKQAKHIAELIIGASCRFGLFLLQKVLSFVAHFSVGAWCWVLDDTSVLFD